MNSASVSDSSTAATAAASSLLAFPGSAPADEAESGFGDVLAQVTSESAEEVEEGDALAMVSPPIEEKEEQESDLDLSVAPLLFFFPPPEIKLPPKLENEGTLDEPQELIGASEDAAPELAICSPPLPKLTPESESNQLLETVRPSSEKTAADAKETKALKAKSGVSKVGGIPLDGFNPVIPEVAELTDLQGSKGLLAPSPAPAPSTHGTVVAKQENAMQNAQKTAENAPVIEQKMPVREQSRRALPEQARFDTAGFVADNFGHNSELSIEAPSHEISVRSLDSARLVETIRTEVANLRHRGDASVTVVLKPDNGTELRLEVTVARDGTIHAHARCERGDFQSLNAQWPQLQQSLAAQGIRVNDLSNPGNSNQNPSDSSQAQNFERGNNPQQRQQQPSANFEDELAASTPRYSTNKTFKTTAAPTRRWQSWA
jgi:hypothetical protein